MSTLSSLLLSLILFTVSLVATQPIGVVGVPFNQTAPQFDSYGCYLNASSLNITSIEPIDLATFYRQLPSNCSEITVDLSFNQLSQLPINLFVNKTTHQVMILSHNLFTGETISNFFSNDPATSTVFVSLTEIDFINKLGVTLDLSHNGLGPLPPTMFQLMKVDGLICHYCGLTSLPYGTFVPPGAQTGGQFNNLDLSYNDFSSPGSIGYRVFEGLSLTIDAITVTLNNCNMRTSSLPSNGLFHTAIYWNPELHDDLSISLTNNPNPLPILDNLTSASYLATWPNILVDLSASIFSAPPDGSSLYQLPVSNLLLGDFISFQEDTGLFSNSTWPWMNQLSINLAPNVAIEAIGGVTNWCPVQQVARAVTDCWRLSTLAISAYGSTAPDHESVSNATECTFPSVHLMDECLYNSYGTNNFILSTEPVLLQRALVKWINDMTVDGNQFMSSIAWIPPPGNNFNPALNRADWMPQNMLCDLTGITTLTLPGLPYPQFSFPPPDNMLACLTTSTNIYNIDWSQSRLFSSGMFDGRPDSAPNMNIGIDLNRLYSGDRPVPVDFFTPLIGHLEHNVINYNWKNRTNPGLYIFDVCSSPECVFMGANSIPRCPYFVNKQCEPCPPGYYPQSFPTSEYGPLAYCKSAPVGSYMTPYDYWYTLPIPNLCPTGTYQHLLHQTFCFNCSAGTYNPSIGSSSLGGCIFCPLGTANPNERSQDSSACQPCPVGTASPAPGVAECLPCAAGTYQNQTGKFQCVKCPANYYLDQTGGESIDNCTQCPPNSPLAPPSSPSSLSCSPVTCEEGFWPSGGNWCLSCMEGFYCDGSKRIKCPPGSFSNASNLAVCYPCGAGYYSSVTQSEDSSACHPCPLSTYSYDLISSSCYPCPSGAISTVTGGASADVCHNEVACQITSDDPDPWTRLPNITATSTYCQTGSIAPMQLSRLLPDGLILIQAFRTQLQLSSWTSFDGTPASVTRAYRRYSTTSQAPSLRLADYSSDETLSAHSATQPPTVINSIGSGLGADGSVLSARATVIILIILLIISFLSWPIYRRIPPKLAFHFDQFCMNHDINAGQSPVNQPTQFGSAVTWTFLWIAVLVAILLGTASNTITTTSLVPPSSIAYAGTAVADFQVTLRAYSSNASVAKYCSDSGLHGKVDQDGFHPIFNYHAQPTTTWSDVCSVTADCLGCDLASGSSSVSFTFPYDTQFFEWEVFISSAAPKTWTRRYGVLTQLPTQLFDAQSELQFNTIESYYTDRTQRGSGLTQSGYEFDFLQYNSIQPQSQETYNPDSTVNIKFVLIKSDIMFDSYSTNILTPFQMVVSILTAIVSLFSIFGIIFSIVEGKLLNGLFRQPSGEVHQDEKGRIRLGHETSTNDVIKESLSHTVNPINSDSVEHGPNEIELEVNPAGGVKSDHQNSDENEMTHAL